MSASALPGDSDRPMSYDASRFYEPWEQVVNSYPALTDFIGKTYTRWKASRRTFAWRGMPNSTWSFHSSLHRRLWWTNPSTVPDEERLLAREGAILRDAHRWGLHRGEHGRLSILEQLAMLQHFGAPTRLIDVSFNPLIAAWFAVQESRHDALDGRLFAIDVTSRLISEDDLFRWWEDTRRRPWTFERQGLEAADAERVLDESRNWRTTVLAWKPPSFFGRISRQAGGFLLGGVPAAVVRPGLAKAFQVPRGPNPEAGSWRIEEVRRSTSVALRFHKADAAAGGVGTGGQPAYTLRISSSAKEEIRDRLEGLFGYDVKSLFGDFPGFATFGTPDLPLDR